LQTQCCGRIGEENGRVLIRQDLNSFLHHLTGWMGTREPIEKKRHIYSEKLNQVEVFMRAAGRNAACHGAKHDYFIFHGLIANRIAETG
jgi:hypothetical protein